MFEVQGQSLQDTDGLLYSSSLAKTFPTATKDPRSVLLPSVSPAVSYLTAWTLTFGQGSERSCVSALSGDPLVLLLRSLRNGKLRILTA